MADGFACGVHEDYRSACADDEYRDTGYCVLHAPVEKKKEDFEEVKKGKLDRKDYDFGGTVFPEGTSDFEGAEFDAEVNFIGATFVGVATFDRAQFSGERTSFRGAQFSGERTSFRKAQFNCGQETTFSRAEFHSGGTTSFGEAQFSSKKTSFDSAQFSGERTSFRKAQFNCSQETSIRGAQFNAKWTHFGGARFSGKITFFDRAQFRGERTHFDKAQFSGERTSFEETQFGGEETHFSEAQFGSEETRFSEAQFGSAETSFHEATFTKEIFFTGATFREKVDFWGSKAHPVFASEAEAWFDSLRIGKPELLTFNTVLLHPGWFINTDVRKVNFTDVKWYGMPGGPKGTLDEEIGALTERHIESPHALLSQACQRLSANAEENREYPLANASHYWSLDTLRKENWRRFGPIRTMYWALSGYGVRAARAFWVLLGMWATFTILYTLVPSSPFSGFSVSDFGEAIVYSLGAMARLNPEPTPDPGWFQFLVTVEGLVGPLQIGLLLLAIRRQVMR